MMPAQWHAGPLHGSTGTGHRQTRCWACAHPLPASARSHPGLSSPLDNQTSPSPVHQPHPRQPQHWPLQPLACSPSSAAVMTLMSCPTLACMSRARAKAAPQIPAPAQPSEHQLPREHATGRGRVHRDSAGPSKLCLHPPPLVYLYLSWVRASSGCGRAIRDLESDLPPQLYRAWGR